MKEIIFFYNSDNDLLYVTISPTHIVKIAESIKGKSWVKEVSDIYFVSLNNEELAQLYLTYYIKTKKPKYNNESIEPDTNETPDLPELELQKVTKDVFKGVDWNMVITSIIGGAALGTSIFPGFGTVLGGIGIGAIVGGSVGLVISLLPLKDTILHIVEVVQKDKIPQK
jgi:hypothetical protein